MTHKKFLPTLSMALIMLFAFGTAAMAQPDEKPAPPHVPSPLEHYSNSPQAALSPAQLTELDALRLEHNQKMAPLHDQLWAKQMEYDAMAANPNSKHADIKAVIEEMKASKSQIRAEKDKFFENMKAKGFDKAGFYGYCFGNDGAGSGHGKGFRRHGMMGHNSGGHFGNN